MRARSRPSRRFIPAAALVAAVVAFALAGLGRRAVPAIPFSDRQAGHNEARREVDAGLALLAASRTEADLAQARSLFERALRVDPGLAPAHAGLATALVRMAGLGIEAPLTVLPRASAEARRAVALDPTLAAGWQALAYVQTQWGRDWDGAEQSYRRAAALDPSAPGPMTLAALLAGTGRSAEALNESDRWLAVAPDAAERLLPACVVRYLVRQPDVAVTLCDRALGADPTSHEAHLWRALAHSALGNQAEAMRSALAARPGPGVTASWIVGYVHAGAGRAADARAVLAAVEAQAATRYVPPVDLALLHAVAGDPAAALGWLERGYRERGRWMEWIGVLPGLDGLRSEPRFRALIKALGLPGHS